MDSDSDENSRSRFSVDSSSVLETSDISVENDRSNEVSKLAESFDESVIVSKKGKNTRKRILESDSESEPESDDNARKDSESESGDSDSGSDSKQNDSVTKSGIDERKSSGSESEGDDPKNSQSESEDDDDTKENQFLQTVESDGNDETDDDDEKSESSVHETTHDSSIVIPETDDDDDDLDEAEKEMSMLVYSPRTRRTITGRRSTFHKPVESDEDEIFPEERSESHSSDYKSAEVSKELELSNDFENDRSENVKRNRSVVNVHDISAIKTPNAKRVSLNRDRSHTSPQTSTPSRTISPDIDFSDKVNGIDASYRIQSDQSASSSNASVVILNSSDEENHQPNKSGLDFKGAHASTPGPSTSIKLIQPKLPFDRKPIKSSKTFVSRAYYEQKADELVVAKKELKDNTELLKNLGPTLPDKGRNMKIRIEILRRDVDRKQTELERYAIEEDHMDDVEIVEPTSNNQVKNAARDWRSDLEAIQPRWTGEQGMSTFNTQKQLTLNRIEKLHKAMEKCPTENDLARQPDNLNVQLMPHQLHAIKWMRWRESQKPKGGILADDMGLGKTLTVIGLVLDDKYGKELSQVEEDDDDDNEEEEKDDTDDENERGYKKSYRNEGNTLIICPASLINQWEKEVENRVKRRKLTILLHHGTKRKESAHSICKYDLVISTYGVISSEHKNNGAMFRIRWKRIVLDEAHMIRNHSTAVAKGCCELRGGIRWGLTGTPIQNKHMDVFSIFKFLRVTPFDDLATYKKWIDPKTQAGMSRLHNILKPLLLRRTKAELQIKGELQALPNKEIIIEDIELTPAEANVYTKILAYSQTLFAQYMEQHEQRTGGGKVQLPSDIQRRLEQVRRFGQGQDVKSSQILVLLLRLRQICDHPGLINQMLMDECDLENCDEEDFGSIEMNMVKQMIGLKISENDKEGHMNKSGEAAKGNNVLLNTNQIFDFKHPSTKCKKTIEIVKRILRETRDKIVIVSQWTSFLNVVSDFLHRERVHYVELTGKTAIKNRNDIVVSFNNPDTPERVLMLSLVAGGVGLNLTGANHLILLDPHWNPQLESQAFDRVYRVGQTKNVNIYKLLCVKTVEKHIQKIQDSKLELSDNVLTGSKSSGSKLSIQDMRQLFDM